jgi:putative flippase GtrA
VSTSSSTILAWRAGALPTSRSVVNHCVLLQPREDVLGWCTGRRTMRPTVLIWPTLPRPHSTLKTAIRFSAVGGFTAAIDVVLLYVLAHFVGLHYFIAAGLSFTLAVLINYFLSIVWVFPSGKFSRRTEVLLFWIICAGGLCLNQIVMTGLVGWAGTDYMAAKICSIVIVTIWNFFGKKKIVFYDQAR